MFCEKCGKQLDDGAAFCSGCGYELNKETSIKGEDGKKKKVIPLILGTVLLVIFACVIFLSGKEDNGNKAIQGEWKLSILMRDDSVYSESEVEAKGVDFGDAKIEKSTYEFTVLDTEWSGNWEIMNTDDVEEGEYVYKLSDAKGGTYVGKIEDGVLMIYIEAGTGSMTLYFEKK